MRHRLSPASMPVSDGKKGQEDFVVVESYNKEPVREYRMLKADAEKDTSHPLRYNCCRPLRKRVHSLRAFFAEVFLPQGYPDTVSADYLDYQLYDTLQAFASSLNGALATLAVLKGVGVGNEQATVLAAALTWILKDGVGMLARIAFAWAEGTSLDSDCKRWRLFADLLNDASFFIDLINPYCPSVCFTPLACFASLLRSIVGVAGGATRMSIIRHQARRDNLADVAAKDGSQETLVNVMSLLVSLVLLPLVEGRPLLIWALFILFTAIHLFANFRAVKSILLETLNQQRLALAVRYFLQHGTAPSINWCNQNETVLFGNRASFGHRRHFGCSLASAIEQTVRQNTSDTCCWRNTQSTICVMDNCRKTAWLAIEEGTDDSTIFNALFELEHFAAGAGWPSADTLSRFRAAMIAQGWSLQVNQLNVDEWRYRRADDQFAEDEEMKKSE